MAWTSKGGCHHSHHRPASHTQAEAQLAHNTRWRTPGHTCTHTGSHQSTHMHTIQATETDTAGAQCSAPTCLSTAAHAAHLLVQAPPSARVSCKHTRHAPPLHGLYIHIHHAPMHLAQATHMTRQHMHTNKMATCSPLIHLPHHCHHPEVNYMAKGYLCPKEGHSNRGSNLLRWQQVNMVKKTAAAPTAYLPAVAMAITAPFFMCCAHHTGVCTVQEMQRPSSTRQTPQRCRLCMLPTPRTLQGSNCCNADAPLTRYHFQWTGSFSQVHRHTHMLPQLLGQMMPPHDEWQ